MVNYLGHLLVLPNEGLVTLGNLLGDFVKGRLDSIEPAEFRAGVQLHRELDRFTDAHPAVRRSKGRISDSRRRVAGVLVDVFYDHFLAEGPDWQGLFSGLAPHVHGLPAPLRDLPGRMVNSRWFGSYSRVEGIAAVLARMDQRRARPLGLSGSESELLAQYLALREDHEEFFPDAVRFARQAIVRLRGETSHPPASY
jgi:acyl carrier protein phosphodiesterase